MAEVERKGRAVIARIFAAILLIVSLPLTAGGAYLSWLGGSPYYLLAGAAMALSSVWIWRGRGEGTLVYLLLLLVTLPWAVWEAGLDGWALLPRLFAPLVLGMVLLLPALRRLPVGTGGWGEALKRHLPVACLISLILSAGAAAWRPTDPYDPINDRGRFEGAAPTPGKMAKVPGDGDWLHFGNDPAGTRFSKLDEITPANVGKLTEAWRVKIGPTLGLETTPIKVGDTLYVCNAYNDVVALDAETGSPRWRYNAGVAVDLVPYTVCRGVAYYKVPGPSNECAERILTNTVDGRLIALDARTGRPCSSFGRKGIVSLLAGFDPATAHFYAVTSAPTVISGKVVLGGWVSDGMQWGEPAGVVRAFDAITGELAWAWDIGRPDRQTLPPPGDTYTHSTPNAWAPFSADEQLGMVYVPTGNPAVDYFGGYRRPFDEAFGSAVVAIDAATGKTRWKFQTVHHDIWDWDNASQPTLIDLPVNGVIRRALIQPTKRGEIFVLDRQTGKPIKPVEERATPQGGIVPGERLSPTQPFSVGLPSFRGPDLTEKTMWGVTPLDQLWCRIRFRESRYEGTATPPGFRPTIVYPGFNGGVDWGSVSVDPTRQIMFVNSTRVANYDKILRRSEADKQNIAFEKKHGALNAPQYRTPYVSLIRIFQSPLGVPCNQPPYGLLSAVDLKSGTLIWSQRFGTARSSGPLGIRSMLPIPIGTPNVGGSLVTASGILFAGATHDGDFHAIDTATGKTLWKTDLRAGGQATPMTYISPRSGHQFVAIAAGGHRALGSVMGDYIVAYRLKD